MAQITMSTLADGRETIYFDDPGSAARSPESLVDHRELPARQQPGQFRFDALGATAPSARV